MSGMMQKYTTDIIIGEYSGRIPVINSQDTGLMLYLNPRGHSNNSVSRDIWTDTRKNVWSQTGETVTYVAKLNNLYYGTTNGWLSDEDGIPYLKLSSGATLNLDNFAPFLKDLTRANGFGNYPGTGFTIELDFSISGILNYQADLIKCLSISNNDIIQTGFVITGEKAYLFNSDKKTKQEPLASVDIIENQRMRISFAVEWNDTKINYARDYARKNTYLNKNAIM